MTEVKLLSIKKKPEHSYFFENEGATFDSNSNKVDIKQNNDGPKMSKKARKASGKEEKKQQKKEMEQCKKEMRASAKMKNQENQSDIKENGNVNLPQFNNPVFQDVTLEKNKEGNTVENASPTSSGPAELVISENNHPGSGGLFAGVQEDVIVSESAAEEEEAPTEHSFPIKYNQEFAEAEQGQHVEVEISEITDLEEIHNGTGSESEIVFAVIQEVESGLDLDSLFIEAFGEPGQKATQEKRKSVRFEEPTPITEQDPGNKTEDNDAKTKNTDEVREQREMPDERIESEQVSNVESCDIDFDELFKSCEEAPKTNGAQIETHQNTMQVENIPETSEVGNHPNTSEVEDHPKTSEVGNHRTEIASDDITLNGKPSEHEEATSKKQKRKKGGLLKCCFP